MTQKQSKHQSRVFREFNALDKSNHHTMVRFYERHQRVIERLPFDEFFVLLVHYGTALFEVGQYDKHIKISDRIVELSIINNVQFYQGEDIYIRVLYQKAQSNFYIRDFAATQHICCELLKMQPYHKSYKKLLRKAVVMQSGRSYIRLQALAMVLFLLSVVILLVNIFVIKNFYIQYTSFVYQLVVGIMGASALTLTLSLVLEYLKVDRFVRSVKKSSIRHHQKTDG